MRVLVCGGRFFTDQYHVFRTLWDLDKNKRISCIIHGGAKGADRIAGDWARVEGRKVEEFPALWEVHGSQAGYIRNNRMVDEGKPDIILAFEGDRGTKMMKRIAREKGIPLKEV